MRIKISRLLTLSGIFLVMLFSASGCFSGDTPGSTAVNLSGSWKIIDRDIAKAADPSFDDSGYPGLNIPGDWLHILKQKSSMSATVWLRKKITIPADGKMKQPVLFAERISVADEIYFNGIKIGSSGIIPDNSDSLQYQISWHTPRKYYIPESHINYGSENVIAVRVYSHIQSGISGEIDLYDSHEGYFTQVIRAYRPIFISIASVTLNFMLILVFILLYISKSSKTEYLYFTLIILCTLISAFLSFSMPFMIDGLWRYKLGIFFYTMTNFFVLLGVKKFLEIENSRITYSAIAALIITEAAVLSAPDSRFLVFYTGYVFLALVNIFIVSAAAMFIYAIKKDPRRYWYFIFLVVPVVISVARNSWYILNFRFSEMPLLIFLHVPLVFMFITLYYIYDFEKSRKEKEQLYTALLRKSKNDARTLQTLKDKNRKPEPRDLISNVIDYLDQNYSEKYDRIELSKKFGLNEDYMGQIFKKAAGTNISSYINTNRINAAKELLTDTSAKIIDIAYHVGFDNLTHFHRQFKKQTGCTPNEYRTIISREG